MTQQLAQVKARAIAGNRVVSVHGEIDISNAGEVYDLLASAISKDDASVVIDLTDTQYLDSAAIRLLLRLADTLDRNRQPLAFAATDGGAVRKLLDITGIAAQYSCLPTASAAQAALTQKT